MKNKNGKHVFGSTAYLHEKSHKQYLSITANHPEKLHRQCLSITANQYYASPKYTRSKLNYFFRFCPEYIKRMNMSVIFSLFNELGTIHDEPKIMNSFCVNV